MKKKGWALLCLCLLCVCCLFASGCSNSENPYEKAAPDNGYIMNNLDVSIDATAGDRSMRIVEKYTFTFDYLSMSHGFFRDIPLNSGEKIRDVAVSGRDFYDEFDVSHENNGKIFRIRVGSADRFVETETPLTCVIEYTMLTPKHGTYPNALVLNAIGQGWSCAIEKAHISVKLPEQTNETPRYYYGAWGEQKDAVADGLVSVSPASGQKTYEFDVGSLHAFEGITLYYFLPKGALTQKTEMFPFLVLIIGIVLVGLAVLFLFFLGRNPEITPITNFYPPKHPMNEDTGDEGSEPMDPVDMGYLIDNTCSGQDVTSLIFYFASKGYLEIKDPDGELTLVHLHDLPESAPSYQKVFFKKLFESGREVTASSLTNKTYSAVAKVQAQIKGQYSGKLYDAKARTASIFISALAVLLSFLTVLFAYFRVTFAYLNLFGLIGVVPAVLLQLVGRYLVNNRLKMKKALQIAIIVGMGVLLAIFVAVYAAFTAPDVLPRFASIAVGLCVGAACAIAPFVSRRTKYYTNELNEVMGFKDFLQTAEKERLEALLAENPQYYYDILPYANVLGVSDIWEDKFKNLTVEPPRYYSSSDAVFDILVFNTFYRHTYSRMASVAVSRPSSSSRSGGGIHFGGGGGGGFSGGGFGGGGGGRW